MVPGPFGRRQADFTSVLYFRNVRRNVYGMIDYARFTTSQNIWAIAAKLIKDARFRSQFIADPADHEMFTADWKHPQKGPRPRSGWMNARKSRLRLADALEK